MKLTGRLASFATLSALLLVAACSKQAAEPVADEPIASSTAEPAASSAALPRTPAAGGARVFFITPADGDTVTSPVSIEFGVDGMSIVTAGDDALQSGHHHLLVDTGLPDVGLPIPADTSHIHFGDASTSTALTLDPGEHTLQLLLGDYLHIPHDPPVLSDPITVIVE